MGTGMIEQESYYRFLTAAISINTWANERMWYDEDGINGGLAKAMAENIAASYGTSGINIVIGNVFYWYYFLLTNNGDAFLNNLRESLNSGGITSYNLIIQMDERSSNCQFLIINS